MNETKNFSMTEAFKFGFSTFFENFMLFFKISLIFAGLYLALVGFLSTAWLPTVTSFSKDSFAFTLPTPHIVGLLIAYGILFYLLKEYYFFQIIKFGLALADKRNYTWKSVFDSKNFFNFLVARSLFHLKVFLGLLLFIIPGIYLYCKYVFTGFPLTDGKAATTSADTDIVRKLTSGVRWKIFWFQMIIGLLMWVAVAGIITLLIMPPLLLAEVHVYRTLMGYYQSQSPAHQ